MDDGGVKFLYDAQSLAETAAWLDRELTELTDAVPTQLSDEYVEGQYTTDADFEHTDFYRVSPIYEEIRKRTENQETKVRSGGMLLLGFGFSLQMVGTAL
ncbi:hypothetical protein [Halomicrococcus sp. NG-SE-24]|uniref:hypothetical protein n=1 Tax=Halomicrococcus sp. NG-SE-24 TaxID=3436928 RepID=UPI003D97FFF4